MLPATLVEALKAQIAFCAKQHMRDLEQDFRFGTAFAWRANTRMLIRSWLADIFPLMPVHGSAQWDYPPPPFGSQRIAAGGEAAATLAKINKQSARIPSPLLCHPPARSRLLYPTCRNYSATRMSKRR